MLNGASGGADGFLEKKLPPAIEGTGVDGAAVGARDGGASGG